MGGKSSAGSGGRSASGVGPRIALADTVRREGIQGFVTATGARAVAERAATIVSGAWPPSLVPGVTGLAVPGSLVVENTDGTWKHVGFVGAKSRSQADIDQGISALRSAGLGATYYESIRDRGILVWRK